MRAAPLPPPMRILLPLLAFALLAGCTAADDAKQALADAQTQLEQAQQEAADAKARFERVRSSTVIREEVLQLDLTVVITNGTLSFDVNASRIVDGAPVAIPRANLTRVPDVRLETSGVAATCEPLTCTVRVPQGFPLTVAWSDKPDERVNVRNGAVLSRSDARAMVTTAAGDVAA